MNKMDIPICEECQDVKGVLHRWEIVPQAHYHQKSAWEVQCEYWVEGVASDSRYAPFDGKTGTRVYAFCDKSKDGSPTIKSVVRAELVAEIRWLGIVNEE